MLRFPDVITIIEQYSMIYYCVKTDEYLTAVLDKVSRGAEYFKQFDVPLDKAENLLKKLTERYDLEQTARQRNYRLNEKGICVVDLVVLLNRSLFNNDQVRFCLLCTVPAVIRPTLESCDDLLVHDYALSDQGDKERFFKITDRKTRLCFHAVPSRIKVYELVHLMFTKDERKQKNIESVAAWTWRLHKDFIVMTYQRFEDAFKKAQKLKSASRFNAIEDSYAFLGNVAGFRGVRKDVFKINQKTLAMSFKYLNQKNNFELKIPSYIGKSSRLTKSFSEMCAFQQRYT